MPLVRSVGSWLTLCLSSQLKQVAEQRKKGKIHVFGLAINEDSYGGWDCERRQGQRRKPDEMGWKEAKGEQEVTVDLSAGPGIGRQSSRKNFTCHVLTPQQMNMCHSPLWPPKGLFERWGKTSLSFYCPPKNGSLLSSLQWKPNGCSFWGGMACLKVFCIFCNSDWLLHALSLFFGFYWVRRSSFWCSIILRRWSVT